MNVTIECHNIDRTSTRRDTQVKYSDRTCRSWKRERQFCSDRGLETIWAFQSNISMDLDTFIVDWQIPRKMREKERHTPPAASHVPWRAETRAWSHRQDQISNSLWSEPTNYCVSLLPWYITQYVQICHITWPKPTDNATSFGQVSQTGLRYIFQVNRTRSE